MGVKRQQGGIDQGDLFDEATQAVLRHGAGGEGGTRPSATEEQQAPAARDQERALTQYLMEAVISAGNLERAYKRVKGNGGAPGVDGMTVDDLHAWIAEHRDGLVARLLDGSYEPQPVRGVSIPKPGGGERQLGIPTVVDRLVQQAMTQVLEPILDPTFSTSSFGFRPGRGAHDALRQAKEYVADGYEIVVDLDLEKFPRVKPEDKLRPGQPRHPDGPSGAAHRRQAPAAHCPPLSSGGDDDERGVRRTDGGHAARRPDVAAAGQFAAGRPGQGAGRTGSPVLPICG
jgi:RNA-directed DNA polymerase